MIGSIIPILLLHSQNGGAVGARSVRLVKHHTSSSSFDQIKIYVFAIVAQIVRQIENIINVIEMFYIIFCIPSSLTPCIIKKLLNILDLTVDIAGGEKFHLTRVYHFDNILFS